jgi:hypothetical protein
MLVLSLCPLKNESTGSLDIITCKSEKITSALERPGTRIVWSS